PVLRSLHEATGVGIWLSCFVLAYLARKTAVNAGVLPRASQADLPLARLGQPVANGRHPATSRS
ncbi:MAG TPA: hypothetical protein VM033_07915, partial [Gemmatimonadaceae bacterium]|nr:hypothetical protein [Gemmatimonadaceae bacterium]